MNRPDKAPERKIRPIQLAATGALPMSKIHARIEKTTTQRAAVEEQLEFTVDRLQYTAESVLSFLALLVDPGTLYGRASDAFRRDLLTAYFNRLVVYVTDEESRSKRNAATPTHTSARSTDASQMHVRTPCLTKTELPARERGVWSQSQTRPVHLTRV